MREKGPVELGLDATAITTRSRPRVLPLAWVAIACGLAGLVAVSAMAAWLIGERARSLRDTERERVSVVARTLAHSGRALIEQDSLGALRQLVLDIARAECLETCSVSIPAVGVVADLDASKITVRTRPMESGPRAVVQSTEAEERESLTDGLIEVTASSPSDRLGGVLVHASRRADEAGLLPVVLAASSAVGLMLASIVILVGRAIPRARALDAVSSALGALAMGETAAESLTVSARWGAEAMAWNALMGERAAGHDTRSLLAALDSPGPSRSGGGLEGACDAMTQGVMVFDSALRVTYANGAAGILLGVSRQSLVGGPASDTVRAPAALDALGSVLKPGSRRRLTVEQEVNQGGDPSTLRFTISRLAPGPSAAASGAVVVVEDVTQQRVADRSRDSFVAQATHELRTPLTNIRLYVETALEEGATDASVRGNCLNIINQESRRLERIVGDMLSLAEMESGALKLHTSEVRTDSVFDELGKEFEAAALDKKLSLTFDLPPKMPVLTGDRDKIVVALNNLIGNAVKYTPEGGAVTVRLTDEGTSVRVAVQDNGIGIAAEERTRVFDKFYRSQDARVGSIKGTGLGLAIAREAARAHGGDIALESELNRGSTFTLTLPRGREAA
ncbi:MAG: PAS domain-containing protein [Phycisphaerae bacterium]|nr:PAS domain-containing protein [Phycisphaerae bacterium]